MPVHTRGSTSEAGGGDQSDSIAEQLAAIASKLETIDSLKEDIAVLKAQSNSQDRAATHGFEDGETSGRNHRPYNKIDFPVFSGRDPRGWILKAKKYFRYYRIPDDEKLDVASMYLEGDALDLFSWLSANQSIAFWEDLVDTCPALQKKK